MGAHFIIAVHSIILPRLKVCVNLRDTLVINFLFIDTLDPY